MLELPFEFAIPQPLVEDELLSLTADEKRELVAAGLQVLTLSGEQVERVIQYRSEDRRPSVNDYFSLILSEDAQESILLTGDGTLRAIAEQKLIEVHGVLWVLDQLSENECLPTWMLAEAIRIFLDDPDVWLPEAELRTRIQQLENEA
jgi:hypothetical protein